jgi:hypothetical protein
MAQCPAHHRLFLFGCQHRYCNIIRRRLDELLCPLIIAEQRFHLAAQRVIAPTGLFEESLTIFRIAPERRVVKLLDLFIPF